MEPKMLEFPNTYCRDRDQGDLDDLIFPEEWIISER